MGNFKRLWKNEKTGLYYDVKAITNLVETDLVYNTETKIVYYKPKNLDKGVKIAFLTPYKKNNKRCQYVNKKIVEVC